ncbi:MAG TPA: hypothetical protein VHJ20_03765 [Polyangia bacterium]|nr:hypothetical protein [Polyangia bacterium]
MRRALAVAAALALVACTSGEAPKPGGGGGTGGTPASGGTTGASGGASGGTTGATGGTTDTGGTGGVSATGGASGGGAGGSPAGGTTGATGGSTGSPDGGPGDAHLGDGPTTTAGCAGKNYQLCIDFENGVDTSVWQRNAGDTTSGIVSDQFAHGGHSYHLYSKAGAPVGGRLLSKTVGAIKNQVWARFYIRFSPGAPGGHGNIVAAYDKSGTWYEMGYQFDGMMGVWHGGGGEHPRRSLPYMVDRWTCVEAYFDGASAAMPKWFIDGAEASYWNPVEGCGTPMVTCDDEMYTCTNGQIACGMPAKNQQTVVEAGPTPSVSTQFTRLEAGFTPYAPLDLKPPNNVGDQSDTRVLQDLWIDDVAFDTQRIGCIQ